MARVGLKWMETAHYANVKIADGKDGKDGKDEKCIETRTNKRRDV